MNLLRSLIELISKMKIDNSMFTVWICIFTLWIWVYLSIIDRHIFTVWICTFTLWICIYLSKILKTCGASHLVSELKNHCKPVGQSFKQTQIIHLNNFQPQIILYCWIHDRKVLNQINITFDVKVVAHS